MKIKEIETIALTDPGKADETLVRVHTDECITGIGQAESPSLVIDAIIRTDGGLQDFYTVKIRCKLNGSGRRCTPPQVYSAGAA